MNERIAQFEDIDFDPSEKFDDEEIDFITKIGYITLNDQCPCGSGKKFQDCCYLASMK